MIEFWTFACYNCRNTLPSLKKWDAQYRDKGLTIIGVHTRGAEIRCYMRDPDGYLIEVGQSTGLRTGKLAKKRPEDLAG